MNVIDVAIKDLKRVFRSPFALIMMFGAPLLIAGLLYFAFGGLASGGKSFTLAKTYVVVVNLDQAGTSTSGFKAGEMLISFLQNKDLSDILELTTAADEASARSAVDHQQAVNPTIQSKNKTLTLNLADESHVDYCRGAEI